MEQAPATISLDGIVRQDILIGPGHFRLAMVLALSVDAGNPIKYFW
jgi:hypothetical protein